MLKYVLKNLKPFLLIEVFSGLFLTLKTAECISLRISDVLEYSNTRNQFINSLGRFNVATLDEISQLHLHDFGIFLDLQPDEEEKQILENNIQMSLQKEKITVAESQKNLDIEKMQMEARIKMQLMEKEFMLNMRLKNQETSVIKDKEKYKEDRKDERTRIQASQQSEMIAQRKQNLPAKKFESSGFDNLGGFDLEQFEPR